MITTQQMAEQLPEQSAAIRYSGVAHVTPEQLRSITGVDADFRRADGRDGDGANLPESVVYTYHPVSGRLSRVMEMESYSGPYPMRGPLGGVAVRAASAVEFVVTR